MFLDCAMVGHDKTVVYPILKIVKNSEFQSQKCALDTFFTINTPLNHIDGGLLSEAYLQHFIVNYQYRYSAAQLFQQVFE